MLTRYTPLVFYSSGLLIRGEGRTRVHVPVHVHTGAPDMWKLLLLSVSCLCTAPMCPHFLSSVSGRGHQSSIFILCQCSEKVWDTDEHVLSSLPSNTGKQLGTPVQETGGLIKGVSFKWRRRGVIWSQTSG